MTRTSRHHTSSTRQNTRREADLIAEFRSRDLSLCQYLSCNCSSLKRVLDLILRLAREDGAESSSRINDWIAEQADSIIFKEMKRTKSAFVASRDLTPEVLASDYIDARLDAIAEDNPFISGRIRNLLSQCGGPPPAEPINCDKDPTASTDVEMEEATPENASDPEQEQEPGHEKRRIEFLYRSVMGQIAFACNRRNNVMQHRNGLMILACGANDRLTTFLYDCGLTTSRWVILQAAASLTKANSTKLKEIGSNKYFHVTIDNIDVTHHVNDRQLDRRTELLHGTFGYAHIQNGDIAGAYNLRAYSAHQASLPRVNLQHLLATPQSDSSFTTGIKAQIYRALARLVPHLGLSLRDPRCTPPPVEQLDVKKPDINLLQMMDESDTSTADVAQVINRLRLQLGLSETEYADSVRILECDGGTSMLVESLRKNRYPFRKLYDGLGTVITVPGVAHLQWCIGAAIYRRYFGDPALGSNYRGSLYITATLLGRKKLDPKKVKDFNQMERLLRDTAQLELLDCLLQELRLKTIDELRPPHLNGLDAVIERVIRRYLSVHAIEQAKANKSKAPVFYESLLRLRDLVDFDEGYFATLQGDIGRVIHWWERMSPFLQAAEGVSHYRSHLPHLLLLLKSDLPTQLTRLVRRGLLISPSGRRGKFCGKDFYLETLNYWLKYFFSVKGAGCSFDKMRDFRQLMCDMKTITGRKSLSRNHISTISPASVRVALDDMRRNKIHRPCDNTSGLGDLKRRPIVDKKEEGTQKLVCMTQSELDLFLYGPSLPPQFSHSQESQEDEDCLIDLSEELAQELRETMEAMVFD
ncbi:BQ5605_C011g06375 [Microbotryum silenes-dioicae]|uniref:BQ5605_C011g06375 protein n=1 Tax=Microbotryum silenes-dioicae TaxID=796604 RepID=A0A2X0M9K1_9BASI|nr:BQ5605_C011g06375 [Microbotryum silenes-dioicae]